MTTFKVVSVHIFTDCLPCFSDMLYWVRYASSYLKLLNHRSIMILSAQRLLPSMLWRIWFSLRKFMYSLLVNWQPWSEFRITGFATINAFFNAVMTILVSRVSSTSQPTIQRLYQSITAVRYRNPRLMGMYVMSIDHAWFGRSKRRYVADTGRL